ncbi:TAXI family TRAP transporter solute-binding subunit [Nocardioides mesophilus]|uniref:TAXI family TRAP transporter solute-binding subunit n=1 Tax=Nocardioides mesophilus TaxID=433659 RepID=A0A7G9R9M0_9ACTN|nr:TAXI family TRAP transporter solute-binding subunit [Nocardioides mesophilus]QNN52295.1 TAXI family TRAP transporter solute-binding subunit [Nocardioides mesophilus]
MRRTTKLAGIALSLTTALAMSACGGQQDRAAAGAGADESSCDAGTGRVNIATGNSTGVYYVVGGGLAQLINDKTELQATAAETGASVQNIQQLVAGDYDIGFSLADTASDAVEGKGDFEKPEDVSTIGRIYSNYTQVVVQADAGIDSVADFKGKRISTGSPQSGTEVIARRLIEAAGLQKGDVKAQRLDLTKTIDGMKDGSLDGFVWSGGLPTPGVTDLFTSKGDDVKFIDVTPLLPKMQEVNPVYEKAVIPADTYNLDQDVPTIAVPNLLMVRNDMADNVACALTTLMLENKDTLVRVHPAAGELSLETAGETGPVPVHPGSKRALENLQS